MENLTLEQINELIYLAGKPDVVAESAKFIQINASNEAQYTVKIGDVEDHVFIKQDNSGNLHAMLDGI